MSVHTIRSGVEIRSPGEPVPEVIEALEKLLDMARSGQLAGISYVVVWSDECVGSVAKGTRTRSMIGELEILKVGLVRGFTEEA